MCDQLLESLPRELFALLSEQPVTIDALRHALANQTAARFSDLDWVIRQLVQEREFDILNEVGKLRSRTLQHLQPTDRIALPRTALLPGLSRISGTALPATLHEARKHQAAGLVLTANCRPPHPPKRRPRAASSGFRTGAVPVDHVRLDLRTSG